MNITKAAFAAACLITVSAVPIARAQYAGPIIVTNGPQANVETASPAWSPRENVIQSQRYDRLVETSSAFREARMRKECGPITDPQLHQQCLDSFAQFEPSGAATGYGSSSPTRGDRSNYGR